MVQITHSFSSLFFSVCRLSCLIISTVPACTITITKLANHFPDAMKLIIVFIQYCSVACVHFKGKTVQVIEVFTHTVTHTVTH